MGTEFLIFNDGLNPKEAKNTDKERKVLGGIIYESKLGSKRGPR